MGLKLTEFSWMAKILGIFIYYNNSLYIFYEDLSYCRYLYRYFFVLPSDPTSNAKWILNVSWEMQGIAVHLNTNVGKCLSSLGKTLTALAGEPDEELSEDEMDARSDYVFSNSPSEVSSPEENTQIEYF